MSGKSPSSPALELSAVAEKEDMSSLQSVIARHEGEAFSMKLERQAIKNAYKRSETVRDVINWGIKIGIVVGLLGFFAVITTWFYHLLVPYSFHWLALGQLYKIQDLISGASLAILIQYYAGKYL